MAVNVPGMLQIALTKRKISLEELESELLQHAKNVNFEGVDWSKAPKGKGVNEWRYDAKGKCGRWLTGKNQMEEFGIVWEWFPAPDFGATDALVVKKTPEDDLALEEVERLTQQIKPLDENLKHQSFASRLKRKFKG